MALLDTKQAASYTTLAVATLAKMRVVGGGPPFIKLGAKVLYDDADLAAWIASHRRYATTAAVAERR